MSNRIKYLKGVALVQSYEAFDSKQRKNYLKLKSRQVCTSSNSKNILDFIINKAKSGDMNIVLHVDSAILLQLINDMDVKRKKSSSFRILIKKCKFLSTYSNADYVREVTQLQTDWLRMKYMISPLSEILSTIPKNKIFAIISPKATPFYDQLREHCSKNNILNVGTLDNIYDFFDSFDSFNNDNVNETFNTFFVALETKEEYDILFSNHSINGIKFTGNCLILEYLEPDLNQLKKTSFSYFGVIKSGAALTASVSNYMDLNPSQYEHTVVMCVRSAGCWDTMFGEKLDE
jgi:hypothetical protein